MRILCEVARGFKVIPQQAIPKKLQQPTLGLVDTVVLQQTFRRLQKALSNSLGNHKYNTELGNPLYKSRREIYFAL